MIVVILERGPKKELRYQHQVMRTAKRQAMSLCSLHNCGFTEADGEIRVHASAYYKREKSNGFHRGRHQAATRPEGG